MIGILIYYEWCAALWLGDGAGGRAVVKIEWWGCCALVSGGVAGLMCSGGEAGVGAVVDSVMVWVCKGAAGRASVERLGWLGNAPLTSIMGM